MRSRNKNTIFLFVCACVTACSGNDSTPNASDGSSTQNQLPTSIKYAGSIRLLSGSSPWMRGDFAEISPAIDNATLRNVIAPPPDTCRAEITRILDSGESEYIDENDLLTNFTSTSIGAGEVLTISSESGTYAELVRYTNPLEDDDYIEYVPAENVALPASIPNGLTVDIPGELFPSVNAAAFPGIDPLVVTGTLALSDDMVLQSLSLDTEYTWEASDISNSRILIALSMNSDERRTEVYLLCFVEDDGSFILPFEVTERFDETYRFGFPNIEREVRESYAAGDNGFLDLVVISLPTVAF